MFRGALSYAEGGMRREEHGVLYVHECGSIAAAISVNACNRETG